VAAAFYYSSIKFDVLGGAASLLLLLPYKSGIIVLEILLERSLESFYLSEGFDASAGPSMFCPVQLGAEVPY
jgi:hypothetical protein